MRRYLFGFLALGSAVYAADVPLEVLLPSRGREPWSTGPLLTPSGNNIPKGHLNIEPYVFATQSSSSYDEDWKRVPNAVSAWNISILPFLQVGMTTWLDFSLIPSWVYVVSNGSATFSFGDCSAALGFQLWKQKHNSWVPSIRLIITETFPVGRFENLDPELFGTDIAGAGSYVTRAALAMGWDIHAADIHWLYVRFVVAYDISSKVHVHGFSSYGGAFDTNGWVYPGESIQVFLAAEYSITQNWAIACDFLANYNTSIRFNGFPGYDVLTGLPADLNVGSSAQYSLAPALEYNWSENLGAISGVWFTFAGRNSIAFTSWVTALNYYY